MTFLVDQRYDDDMAMWLHNDEVILTRPHVMIHEFLSLVEIFVPVLHTSQWQCMFFVLASLSFADAFQELKLILPLTNE